MLKPQQRPSEGQGAFKAPWPRWGFWPKFLLVMILIYAVPYGDFLISALIYHPLIHLLGQRRAYFYNDMAATFGNAILYIGIAHWSLGLFGFSLTDIGFKKISLLKLFLQIAVGAGLAVVDVFVIGFALYHMQKLFFYGHWPVGFSVTWRPSYFAHPLFWRDNVCWLIMGGFLEELTERGVLYTALRSRFSALGAILTTAAYFSISHLIWRSPNPDFMFFFSTFISGILLGCLREWSGTLWCPMAAHFLGDFLLVWTRPRLRWF
ncbi:MAG TPA: CPBP family intramembrane glutamic endopeptidase [Elusimicrobiota bacterium]|nr:CPBP family intramembrane glutamic endopeptidase [Elusimicrobiota bacterium]